MSGVEYKSACGGEGGGGRGRREGVVELGKALQVSVRAAARCCVTNPTTRTIRRRWRKHSCQKKEYTSIKPNFESKDANQENR